MKSHKFLFEKYKFSEFVKQEIRKLPVAIKDKNGDIEYIINNVSIAPNLMYEIEN